MKRVIQARRTWSIPGFDMRMKNEFKAEAWRRGMTLKDALILAITAQLSNWDKTKR
jgi:hypothetical protein